jgi:hypothetical protein
VASCSGASRSHRGLTIASFSVLPSRLRHWVNALWGSTVQVPRDGPTVHARMLTAIAGACRDHQQLRLDYRDHGGSDSIRTVKPHRLVCWVAAGACWRGTSTGGLADLPRRPARARTPTGPRFTAQDLPDGGVAAHVTRGVVRGRRYRARMTCTHRPRRSPSGYRPQSGCWKRWMSARACWTPAPTPSTRSLSTWAARGRFRSQRTSRPCRLHPQAGRPIHARNAMTR